MADRDADALCRLACLTYQDDEPARLVAARELVAREPGLAGASIWTAAVASDPEATQRWLAADRSLATTRGGPLRWGPLFHLAYSRLDPAVSAERVVATARLLLEAGADPNEGHHWGGLPIPFTVLTGVFGHGERGVDNEPAHPQAQALARVLLEAGADPNDAQTLYNRMFADDDDHLELLLEHGLGRGDDGAALLRGQLTWAVSHDQLQRVKLLVAHGVDLAVRDEDGHRPAELAALSGSAEIVEELLAHGAPALALDAVDTLAAAIMAGDRAAVLASGSDLVDELLTRRPWLIVWATARHRLDGVRLMVELGWDVDAHGRGDIPSPMPWQTALHQAALDGDVGLLRLLLGAGADPDVRDQRFDATPLGWARFAGQDAAIAVLEPITTIPPGA